MRVSSKYTAVFIQTRLRSSGNSATMVEQLSFDTVIIVACVCGSVVLILTIILIVLCCRRHETKYYYEKAEHPGIMRPLDKSLLEYQTPTNSSPSLKNVNISIDSGSGVAAVGIRDDVTSGCKCTSGIHDNIDVSSCLKKVQNTADNYGRDNNVSTPDSCGQVPDNCDVINGSTLTSESKRPKKIIYEVVV